VREQYYKETKASRTNSKKDSKPGNPTGSDLKSCVISELNCDIIGDIFWDKYSYILTKKSKK